MTHPIATDASATATLLQKCVYGDGQGTPFIFKFRVYYDGAAWQVSTVAGTTNLADSVTATWDGVNNKVDLTYDFSGESPALSLSNIILEAVAHGKVSGWITPAYWPQARHNSGTAGYLAFYNDSGTLQSTESTAMDAIVTLFGNLS